MSFTFDMQRPCRSLILLPLAVLALAGSACGVDSAPQELGTQTSVQVHALDNEPCTVTENSPPPTLQFSSPGSGNVIVLQCGDAWEAPVLTATDACGQPLQVHQYNTGDDDGDGIPGDIDPDDFGPGPNPNVNALYYVQYLAWDEFFHVSSVILDVHVVNCPEE
ncbi:hypothetical protein [Hyalangium versicolor]|uniref:hypothetical protein n=1 Tax=Hyalangium versicolor TaxID=2861190 RepID=UPI001CCAFE77|nr:hypothetical protein [Hyalangium versicolor]